MRFFFRSRQFKIIVCVVLIIAILSLAVGLAGSRMAPQADIAGAIAAPFKTAAGKISNAVSDFISAYRDGNELMLENAELNAELNELREKVAENDQLSAENEFYKQYLEIRELNPDFVFSDATVISRDTSDPYGSFTINRGSMSDISVYDPVITDAGLVGYITEVGTITAKVTTVLDPDLTLGALDSRTGDSGIISGRLQLAENGLCRFGNLSRSCSVAIGDYIVTSGEGIFPEGLLVGSITSIGADEYNTSIYADITPFVKLDEIRSVMVITEFEGQGGIDPSEVK